MTKMRWTYNLKWRTGTQADHPRGWFTVSCQSSPEFSMMLVVRIDANADKAVWIATDMGGTLNVSNTKYVVHLRQA